MSTSGRLFRAQTPEERSHIRNSRPFSNMDTQLTALSPKLTHTQRNNTELRCTANCSPVTFIDQDSTNTLTHKSASQCFNLKTPTATNLHPFTHKTVYSPTFDLKNPSIFYPLLMDIKSLKDRLQIPKPKYEDIPETRSIDFLSEMCRGKFGSGCIGILT